MVFINGVRFSKRAVWLSSGQEPKFGRGGSPTIYLDSLSGVSSTIRHPRYGVATPCLWIILFSVGYWQWFVLVPAIVRRWRRR